MDIATAMIAKFFMMYCPSTVAKPDTIFAWYLKLIAQKFDGSKRRQYPGPLALRI
jgi:hypothetical protein